MSGKKQSKQVFSEAPPSITVRAEEGATKTAIVYREDSKLVKNLGAELLRGCRVAEWAERGRGRYRKFYPRAWLVPCHLLSGKKRIGQSAADAIRAKRAAAAKKGAETSAQRMGEAAAKIGALPSSRTARAFRCGRLDQFEAKLIAFMTRFRHEFTDYDALLRRCDSDGARDFKQEHSRPEDWETYLDTYNFPEPELAEALSKVLKEPHRAHPVWFCGAILAIKRVGVSLDSLTYETIVEQIRRWQAERAEDKE